MYYQLKELYWNIKTFFFPHQKWLTKKIPNHWIDKVTLWEICILEGLKHYVEEEIGVEELFDKNRWKEWTDKEKELSKAQIQFEEELKVYYNYVNLDLPTLNNQLEDAWKRVHKQKYETKYGEIDRLENTISDLKTKVMLWCVLKREFIWT